MKTFTTWLDSKKDKYSALRDQLGKRLNDADLDYRRTSVTQIDPKTNQRVSVPLAQARGGARLDAKDTVKRLGDLLQEALVRYWAEVVNLTYQRLDSKAAQLALSIEWDKLLHASGRLTNISAFIAELDAFSKHFSLKKGSVSLWEQYPMGSPESAAEGDAFIPEIGLGFALSYQSPERAYLPFQGEIALESKSKKDFEQGAPGSAWIGLLTIGQRTGGGAHRAFLVPALHMEKHLSMPHNPGTVPVEQWGASGHQEALVRCIAENRIDTSNWHRTEHNPEGKLKSIKDCTWIGCVVGFAMVKAYNAIGHQWAFTSGTLQPTGTAEYRPGPNGLLVITTKGDDFKLPTSWAVAIWKSTKDLTGNIDLRIGGFIGKSVESNLNTQKPGTPPPPPPAPGKNRFGPLKVGKP